MFMKGFDTMSKSKYIQLLLLNLFDLFLIMGIGHIISGFNIMGSYILLGIALIIFSIMFIKSKSSKSYGTEVTSSKNIDILEDSMHLVKKAEELKGDKLQIKFVENEVIINSAFYANKVVYINVKNPVKKDYFEGMLAHELGHAITGFGDGIIYFALSLTSITASIITGLRYSYMKRKKKSINKYLDSILYGIIMVLSYKDHFFFNKFIKEDEIKANDYALELTDGHSLRTYYYKVLRSRNFEADRFDLRHPPVNVMLDRMESQMNLDEHELDIFHINSKIYFVRNTVNKEDIESKKHNYYLNIADHSNQQILNKLSNDFLRGNGTTKDNDKAIFYSLKAVEQGSVMALYNLGLIYEQNEDYELALSYLYKAQEKELRNVHVAINRINKKYIICPWEYDSSTIK